MHSADIEIAITNARADLDVANKNRSEIEAALHSDPVHMLSTVNRQTGSLYNVKSASRKLADDLGEQEREITRLNLVIEKLAIDLPAAKVRDQQAREAASDVSRQMAKAESDLVGVGEAHAAALRDLIRQGTEALEAMSVANAALPPGERLTPSPLLARLLDVPELVVSQRMVDVWLNEETKQAVDESRLRVWPGSSLDTLREARVASIADVAGRRAFFVAVLEVTFIPAHRYDWLGANSIPVEQTRYEKVPADLAQAREAVKAT